MRILLLFLLLNVSNLFAQAPSYVNFEWDILQLGYTNASNLEGPSSGFMLGSEMRYNLRDDLSIGIGSDFAFYVDDLSNKNADIYNLNSGIIMIDTYMNTTSAKRAFFGLGIGEHVGRNIQVRENEDTETLDKKSSFGFSPRIGYELNHCRIRLQYNFLTKKEMSNYLTLNVGITLWGGYKQK